MEQVIPETNSPMPEGSGNLESTDPITSSGRDPFLKALIEEISNELSKRLEDPGPEKETPTPSPEPNHRTRARFGFD